MKANELMIGDWVRFSYGIRKVTELDSFLNVVCSQDFSESEVNAIPITPEIIEKNFPQEGNCGLKYSPHIGRTCDLENGNTLWIGKWHNGATRDEKERTGVDPAEGWWEIVYCEHPYLYEYGMKVRFVHQLQHCLKMVGIDKEIIL